MKNNFTAVCCLLFALFIQNIQAEKFEFQYAQNDEYRILSTVEEDVYINGIFEHHSQIVNRISVNVTDVKDGSGVHSAVFMTSENAQEKTGKTFSWGTEYVSVFERSASGRYTISDEYFMPVVRNVPLFPAEDILQGGTWEAQGEEAYDLRQIFGIEKPFKVPFTARYTYTGKTEKNGKELDIIEVRYTMFFDAPKIQPQVKNDAQKNDYPVRTMGYSNQIVYFDNKAGNIDSYSEQFRIVMDTLRGNTFEYRGTAKAEVTMSTHVSSTENIARVQQQIDELGIKDTAVTADETGITISIENINFLPDSAVLTDSEKIKLDKIGTILSQFPENDLLVSGHTALAGSANMRMQLSVERAESVAEYLAAAKIKESHRIFTQGFGAEKPAAPNSTEQGRQRNRRVEIKILN